MKWIFANVLFSSLSASAMELSLDLGRFGAGRGEDVGRAAGSLVRVGVAGSNGGGDLVQLAAEGRWGAADGLDGGEVGAGWAGLGVRYLRLIPSATRAQPFAGLGFELGSDLRRRSAGLEVFTPSVSGHLAAGLRLPFSDAVGATMAIAAGLDGTATPWLGVTLGAAWAPGR